MLTEIYNFRSTSSIMFSPALQLRFLHFRIPFQELAMRHNTTSSFR